MHELRKIDVKIRLQYDNINAVDGDGTSTVIETTHNIDQPINNDTLVITNQKSTRFGGMFAEVTSIIEFSGKIARWLQKAFYSYNGDLDDSSKITIIMYEGGFQTTTYKEYFSGYMDVNKAVINVDNKTFSCTFIADNGLTHFNNVVDQEVDVDMDYSTTGDEVYAIKGNTDDELDLFDKDIIIYTEDDSPYTAFNVSLIEYDIMIGGEDFKNPSTFMVFGSIIQDKSAFMDNRNISEDTSTLTGNIYNTSIFNTNINNPLYTFTSVGLGNDFNLRINYNLRQPGNFDTDVDTRVDLQVRMFDLKDVDTYIVLNENGNVNNSGGNFYREVEHTQFSGSTDNDSVTFTLNEDTNGSDLIDDFIKDNRDKTIGIGFYLEISFGVREGNRIVFLDLSTIDYVNAELLHSNRNVADAEIRFFYKTRNRIDFITIEKTLNKINNTFSNGNKLNVSYTGDKQNELLIYAQDSSLDSTGDKDGSFTITLGDILDCINSIYNQVGYIEDKALIFVNEYEELNPDGSTNNTLHWLTINDILDTNNYKGTFGSDNSTLGEDLPPSANEGDTYLCNKNNFTEDTTNITFNVGEKATYESNNWVKYDRSKKEITCYNPTLDINDEFDFNKIKYGSKVDSTYLNKDQEYNGKREYSLNSKFDLSGTIELATTLSLAISTQLNTYIATVNELNSDYVQVGINEDSLKEYKYNNANTPVLFDGGQHIVKTNKQSWTNEILDDNNPLDYNLYNFYNDIYSSHGSNNSLIANNGKEITLRNNDFSIQQIIDRWSWRIRTIISKNVGGITNTGNDGDNNKFTNSIKDGDFYKSSTSIQPKVLDNKNILFNRYMITANVILDKSFNTLNDRDKGRYPIELTFGVGNQKKIFRGWLRTYDTPIYNNNLGTDMTIALTIDSDLL